MSNEIVMVIFPNRKKPSYAIYHGFNGTIMSWLDLEDVLASDNSRLRELPQVIVDQIRARMECTALFEREEDARKTMDLL